MRYGISLNMRDEIFYGAFGQIPELIPGWPQPQVLRPIIEDDHHSGPPSMMDKLTGILVKVNMITYCLFSLL